jgi:hypothetical protein
MLHNNNENNEENYPITQYQISLNSMPLDITLNHIFPYLEQRDMAHLILHSCDLAKKFRIFCKQTLQTA